jgi:transposase
VHPGFNELLVTELGTFTEQQKHVCYLMRIGLSKPDIQNVTNLSRVTVWRWTKKFEWALG